MSQMACRYLCGLVKMTIGVYALSVDEDSCFSEFDKPRYLLPEGCKDLNDVIRLQEQAAAAAELQKHFAAAAAKLQKQVVTIPDKVSVQELAGMLQLKAYQLITLLIRFKVFASAETEISFDTASAVCARLGVEVRRAEGD